MATRDEIKINARVHLQGDYGTIDDVCDSYFTIEWDSESFINEVKGEEDLYRQSLPYNWQFFDDLEVIQSNSSRSN